MKIICENCGALPKIKKEKVNGKTRIYVVPCDCILDGDFCDESNISDQERVRDMNCMIDHIY